MCTGRRHPGLTGGCDCTGLRPGQSFRHGGGGGNAPIELGIPALRSPRHQDDCRCQCAEPGTPTPAWGVMRSRGLARAHSRRHECHVLGEAFEGRPLHQLLLEAAFNEYIALCVECVRLQELSPDMPRTSAGHRGLPTSGRSTTRASARPQHGLAEAGKRAAWYRARSPATYPMVMRRRVRCRR
jgi:hypothetical protein